MDRLTLIKTQTPSALEDFISKKQSMGGEDGLSLFQLNLCIENIIFKTFIEDREFLKEWSEWELKELETPLAKIKKHIEKNYIAELLDFVETKKELLEDYEAELDDFEIHLISKLFTYRKFVKEIGVINDYTEYTNELLIELIYYSEKKYGRDAEAIGLLDYLVIEEIIE
jgi:hypothetical protein